jgi:hypothetical protein
LIALHSIGHVDDGAGTEIDGPVATELIYGSDATFGGFD